MEPINLIGLLVTAFVFTYAFAVLAFNLPGLLVVSKKIGCLASDSELLQLARDDEDRETSAHPSTSKTHGSCKWRRYLMVLLTVALVTAMTAPLHDLLDLANIVMIFLLAVVFTAIRLGRGAAILAAFLSVAAFDFFFVPPRFSFAVSDIQYLVTFAVMLVVALVIGQLTAGLLYYAKSAQRREQRMRSLYEMSRELSSALSVEQTIDICQRFIKRGFNASVVVFVPGRDGRLQLAEGLSELETADASIAQWSFDHGQIAGLGTDTLPSAQALYVPLKVPTHICGVLVLVPESTWEFPPEQQQMLDTSATLIAIALERIQCVILARDAQVTMESERLRHSLLQESEQQLQEITATLAEGLYVVDREGRITFINPAALAMLGWSEEELLGQVSYTLFHHTMVDGVPYLLADCPLCDVLNQSTVSLQVEEWLWRRDGTRFPVSMVAAPILRKGELRGAVVAFRDITNHKQTEERLHQAKEQAEQAAKAKSQFLATMSHEIRTPLHAILGMLELLHDAPLADHYREQVHIAFAASKSLLALINEILDYSKMEAGEFALDRVDFNVRTLLNEVALIMTPLAQQKKITLSVVFHSEQYSAVSGDPNCLRAVFVNLISNAIKFTPEGGHVTCQGSPVGRNDDGMLKLLFEVRDTGIGIPVARRAAIFAPFIQGDETTTRQYGGTGLGLAITQRFIGMMGGEIQVDSNPYTASGSVFHFTVLLLPRMDGAALNNVDQPLDRAIHWEQFSAADILVVDDQETNLKVTCAMLVKLGCDANRIVSATNGQQAVEQFQNGRFHLVLMDCQMPVMDGYQATHEIREWERKQGKTFVPVLAFTADVTTESRSMMQAAEMSDFLTKPVTLADLRAILSKHLAHTDSSVATIFATTP
ncbi:MAG: DUF4118 domain-containing protein [Magnetococcales bacterium]|nr:DUF4118 domain-containing protein [Magnetococcales bacterium]